MKIAIINAHIANTLGGSELQCDIIARRLQDFGHQVIYLAVQGPSSGYSGSPYMVRPLRLDHQAEFQKILENIWPDIVYWRYNRKYFCSSMEILNEMRIPVVFSVSHKNDVTRNRTDLLIPGKSLRKIMHNWKAFFRNWNEFKGFRYVDGVSNQCRDFMGKLDVKREIYFPNSMNKTSAGFSWNRSYCVWASSIKKRKDPDSLLQLAEKLKNEPFDIIAVGEIQDERYQFFSDRDALPANLHYLGVKSYDEVNGMIKNSQCLIHTCRPEGFPNNFIQAWSFGKPVVSLHYDPDGLIEKHNLGFYSKTLSDFVADVTKLMHNPGMSTQLGKNGKKLSKELFDPDKNVKKLESFLFEIISARKS